MSNAIQQPEAGIAPQTFEQHLVVEYLDPQDLILNPKNPRKHPPEQIDAIKESINAFGFCSPVLIDPGKNVVAGAACVEAARQMKLEKIPTITIHHLTEAKIKGFRLALNRLAEQSGWDDALLAEAFEELLQLEEPGYDLETIGYSIDEMEVHIEELRIEQEDTPNPDDDVPPEVEGPPVCEEGDKWGLGEHCVMHGDATKREDCEELMDGKEAAAATTDPPYDCNYGGSAKDKMRGVDRQILNDNLGEKFGEFLEPVCANILAFTSGAVYIFMSS
ncbi:MAG: site-specific DNA-methyltransferase, partial [Patescibacteria group bacterium]|nr:site-specific DNA-methyltransferase [Patescibacteria group bacterium]